MPAIYLSPGRRLCVEGEDLEKHKDLAAAFSRGAGHGLLFLDTAKESFTEEPAFAFWKDFARGYLSLFSATPGLDQHDFSKDRIHVAIPGDDLGHFLLTAPPMKGAEYIDKECLQNLWHETEAALNEEISGHGKGVADFFLTRHSNWNLLGRVCFHLAENKKSTQRPFAFLATYAHQVTPEGRPRHMPLSEALKEYAGSKNRQVLLRLLSPIHKASQESPFLREIVDTGDIYHPVGWTAGETHRFLKDIPLFEKSGIVVRVPNWWKPKQPNRPQVTIRVGEKRPDAMGLNALMDFRLSVVLGDKELSENEIQDLLAQSERLIFFKGQWVELDRKKLGDILSNWKAVADSVKDGGITFAEGLRWLSGLDGGPGEDGSRDAQSHARVISGQWLKEALESLRAPETSGKIEEALKIKLRTELRPYQSKGAAWLNALYRMRLGAILADDMGLGKTIQVLALLLFKQSETRGNPALLIVPVSLIGNWKAEIDRFAPSLKYRIAHPSGDGMDNPSCFDFDLLITTYGFVARTAWLLDRQWDIIIADEAQAIKNPSAKQTRAVKALKSNHRLVLTGTPVENHLSDLWSLFDFVSPGLLGSAKDFERFVKRGTENGGSPYAGLKALVRPYILRRLKTDKNVIRDLPDKTELKTYCSLSREQATLYQASVTALARDLEHTGGIQRRGIVLSYLMRFKQICNHPSHFVKDGKYSASTSGKFLRLKEICETISEKQEKVLVFTQFKEIIEPLADFLASVFGRRGLLLHGDTPAKKRTEMVEAFAQDIGPPYFVLSLKAGGTGLNLTAASHVVHFDRWWNPAVENQATDRAFRIGQKQKVLVHKFICKGTLEEKIDALIESKQGMSKEILDGAEGALLTELPNEELLKLVSLDINSSAGEI